MRTSAWSRVDLGSVLHDVRYGFRLLTRNPTFTLIAVATLAIGIGANTAVFSIVDAVLLRPLPYREPDRLVRLTGLSQKVGEMSVSEPEFYDYRDRSLAFANLGAYRSERFNLTEEGEPERVAGLKASASVFEVLGIRPIAGRLYRIDEDAPLSEVAIISYGLWQRRYGGDPRIVDRRIQIDGRTHRIIAVMPATFRFPSPDEQIWIPLGLDPAKPWLRQNHYLNVIGRLRPDVSTEQAIARVESVARSIAAEHPEVYAGTGFSARVVPLHDSLVGGSRDLLLVLFGAVGFVLLIACANVGSLLLSRTAARLPELTIRQALGASRARLGRQILTESVTLAAVGGLFGSLLAYWTVRFFIAIAPGTIPRLDEAGLDGRVLGVTALVSIAAGLLFGLAPVVRMPGSLMFLRLRSEGSERAGGGRRGGMLVAAEVGLALVLVTGAGLLIRTLMNLSGIDPGFRPESVVTMRVVLPQGRYKEPQQVTRFFEAALARIQALPGVRFAGFGRELPLESDSSAWSFEPEGASIPSVAQAPTARPQQVTSGYFEALGIRLVQGRTFTDRDRAEAPGVVMLNETMARRYWPDTNPVGQRMRLYGAKNPWLEIVGVVADVRQHGLAEPAVVEMYFPHVQTPITAYFAPADMTLIIRTDGTATAEASAIIAAIHEIDRNLPVTDVRPLEQVVSDSMAGPRFATLILSLFGATALLLAIVGIYGVLSHAVAQRTYEFGIRMAMGARPVDVRNMVLAHAAGPIAIGLAVGIGASLILTRALGTLLYGVEPNDPITLAATTVVLAMAAFVACGVPAWKATRVDPLMAIKE